MIENEDVHSQRKIWSGSSENGEESLFSLELVVEKLYIPHTPCRFPAIAFRLLDFPTIVINHVETDLEKIMRQKILLDSEFVVPDQFIELKDRHGNFMIKKGKSCLFKMPVNILKKHLESTPLYVMVIDMFPETPKLVGNSTVPLDYLMDSICTDINRLGSTVPSSHGDKGLFKLYNLMGKEMGYFVLGVRVLSLGPSLIPHLPDSSLMKRSTNKEVKTMENMIRSKFEPNEKMNDSIQELRNSACMTDPVKDDRFIQTIDTEDKAINVEMHAGRPQHQIGTDPSINKISYSISTQTQKVKKVESSVNSYKKLVVNHEHQVDDDEIIITNIACPPPLFYNSKAKPQIEIKKQNISLVDDLSVDDLSDVESFDGPGLSISKRCNEKKVDLFQSSRHSIATSPSKPELTKSPKIPQARKDEFVKGLQVAPHQSEIFPLLTALINELSHIQDPRLLLNISNKIQSAEVLKIESRLEQKKRESDENVDEISPTVVSAVAEALKKKLDNSRDNMADLNKSGEKQKKVAIQKKGNKSRKGPISSKTFTPMQGKKNKMLSFGITNTQRLRLQKTNPEWLKHADEQAEKLKSQKQPAGKNLKLDDMNATTFSDTLTEVRRLAEKELESTAGGDTLQLIADDIDVMNSSLDTSRKTAAKLQNRQKSHSAAKSTRNDSFQDTPKPKTRTRVRQKVELEHNNLRDSSDSEAIDKKKPVPLERNSRNIPSPAFVNQETGINGNGKYYRYDMYTYLANILLVVVILGPFIKIILCGH